MARHRLVLASGFVTTAVLILFLLQIVRPAASHLTYGFSSYYTASRLIREGWSVTDFYDDSWFRSQSLRLGFVGADDIYNLNPPTTALILWPLSALAPKDAKAVWTGLNLLILGLVLGGLIRIVRGGPGEVAVGVVLIAFFQPVREGMLLGQVYAFLLALEVVFLWFYVEGRASLVGLCLGLILGLKTAGVGLGMLLVSRKWWRALIWTGFTLSAIVAASMLVLGVRPWLRYTAALGRFGTHPELAATAYQDVPGLFLHLFRPDDTWNPSPLLAAPVLSTLLSVASALTMVGLTLRQTWWLDPASRRGRALAFTAWVTLELVLSPVSEDYHYVLALAPISILLADWRDTRPGRRWLTILVFGICLIGAPLPYKAPSLAIGGWSLLAYPKLYGALLMWGLALSALHRERCVSLGHAVIGSGPFASTVGP